MAIENNDLFVLQKNGGGELRKASVAALLSEVVTPVLPDVSDYLEKPGTPGDFIITEAADGTITYTPASSGSSIDGGVYAT